MRSALTLAFLALAAIAHAELVEIPLTTLPGAYPGSEPERTEVFAFPWDPAAVHGAYLRVVGTLEEGAVVCDGVTLPYPMEVYASMLDDGGGWWSAWGPHEPSQGAFEFTVPFQGSLSIPATWDFLGAGSGMLHFTGTPVGLVGICGPILADPSAEVTEVTLIFDLSSTVNTTPATWSRLKAVYR
jgi:hypothetical protein